MGVSTNCNIAYFSKDLDLINRYTLEGRADNFIYGLIGGSGAYFDPEKHGGFTDEEMKIMKIYFDENSLSVSEGYARITPNVQDPNELLNIWLKIRSNLIKEFNLNLAEYRQSLLDNISELKSTIQDKPRNLLSFLPNKKSIQIPQQQKEISDDKFKRILFDYTWSLDSISMIISALTIAIKNEYLVEITASDW